MKTKSLGPVRVGLIGLGTIGCGTLNVLSRNRDEISRRVGRDIEVVAVADLDLTTERPVDLRQVKLTDDASSIINDADIDVVIELIGGIEPAKSFILQSLRNGKSVVTANKELIAQHGEEIFRVASENSCTVGFEAAVAGSIPVIKTMREALVANSIGHVTGIVNGTCNYMLTAMTEQQLNFDVVLEEAQSLGYAEADPAFDVDGIDAAHKITILASIAFGIPLDFGKVFVEGIRDIEMQDVGYADSLGFAIKHVARAARTKSGIEVRVHPALLPKEHPLADVNGVTNAVFVEADAVGPMLLSGAGAGADPTASSVIGDLADIVRTSKATDRVPHLGYANNSEVGQKILEIAEVECANYLRFEIEEEPGILADVGQILASNAIPTQHIEQRKLSSGEHGETVLVLTRRILDKTLVKAIGEIGSLRNVKTPVTRYRIELQNS